MSLHKLPRITFADVIIEAMPFSDELITWCNAHPELKEALKPTHPERFIALGHITTSYSPNVPHDQIIGFYAYDYISEKFKQDFIVNVGGTNSEFVLYTRLPKDSKSLHGKFVKDINEFFAVYGKRRDYAGTHHPSLDEIVGLNDPLLTDRATRYIKQGVALKRVGHNPISQDKLREALNGIKAAKAERSK